MTTASVKSPCVLDYLDVISYLKDYYQYRKQIDKGFSYETWAAELEFKSRSFLRMMVVGKKKVTDKVAEAIQRQNFSEKDEQNYFFYLVKYSQAGNSKERQVFGQKMMEILKRQNNSKVIEDRDEFTSDPLLTRMLSLFSYEDLENTVATFSQILDISEEQTTQALHVLKKLGLAEDTAGSNLWTSKVHVFRVPDNKGSLNLRQYHEKSLLDAIAAFDLPKETRSYKSLLLPMNTDEFEVFIQMVNDFSKEQIARHSSKTYKGKRLFQVNFNVYPVAKAVSDLST